MGAALVGFVAAQAFAAGGTTSTKAAVGTSLVRFIDQTNTFEPILTASIHIPQQKDIHADVSLECALMTDTTVRSKGKKAGDDPDSATAEASVQVQVKVYDETGTIEVPGVSVIPAVPVTFCKRAQTLTAALQGYIGNSSCFDEDTGVFDPQCAELFEEEVGLVLDTLNANAFNFVIENLDSGVYTIKAEAEIKDCTTDGQNCPVTPGSESGSTAMIGLGVMVLDEVRLDNDHTE
jgi:hypothetical protein